MSESERGCGYRKIGGLYLVCDPGIQLSCDGLPLPLEPCGCCGFKPPFSRNIQRIQAEYIIQAEKKLHEEKPFEGGDPYIYNCSCPEVCPICHAESQSIMGLMFVGAQSYTPETFIKEACSLGVSKRIPELPSWLILGKTWIFLAHMKTPKENLNELTGNTMREKEPETEPAIFYGFIPQRVEMPVWKGDLTDQQILDLEAKGITPVLLEQTPENLKRHKNAKNMAARLEKLLYHIPEADEE